VTDPSTDPVLDQIDSVVLGVGTVPVSRVLYGWSDQMVGGNHGLQFLASTPDLAEDVRGRRLDELLVHRDLYLNMRQVDLPQPLVVLGLDVLADRWCVFRKQPAENAPNRHLVEFLLAPPGVRLTPADAFVWADHHAWITRTDGLAELGWIELPLGDRPRFDGLEPSNWHMAQVVLLHLLETPEASLAVTADAVKAEELFRFAFAALPTTVAAGRTFSTYDSTQSQLQVAATPLAREMHGRQVIDAETPVPTSARVIAEKLGQWETMVEDGPAGMERLRVDMEVLRRLPVRSLADLTAYLAVLDGTAGYQEVAELLGGPLARSVVRDLSRHESHLELLVDAVTERVGVVASSQGLGELQQCLVDAALCEHGDTGTSYAAAYLSALAARASAVLAMGPASDPARRRRLEFLTGLVHRMAAPQAFDSFVWSVFGNGVGAPPEIRSLVLWRQLELSDEPAGLRIGNAEAKPIELAPQWWVVPTDDLPELLGGSAPVLPEHARLRLIQYSFYHERPTPSAWLRFAHPDMSPTEVSAFIEWLDAFLVEWLASEPGVGSEGHREVEPIVLDWFLDSGDLTPEVMVRVLADSRMEASPLGESIVEHPDRLLRALFRETWLEPRLCESPGGKRRRRLLGGSK